MSGKGSQAAHICTSSGWNRCSLVGRAAHGGWQFWHQGSAPANQKLSEDRARSVKVALAALPKCKGVTFQTEGHGKNNPVADNATATGRARNRRVEVTIVPKN